MDSAVITNSALFKDIIIHTVHGVPIMLMRYVPFHFSLPTGCRCICGCASTLACVFGTLFVADVTLLGWSSLGFDTVQHTNG